MNLSKWWVRAEPAEESALKVLVEWSHVKLPLSYLEVLRASNGGEGPLAIQPWGFQLWPAAEIPDHHAGYETAFYFPEYLGFGSSGGGVMLAFKKGAEGVVFGIDFCNSDPNDIWVIAKDFETFAASMGIEAQQSIQPDGPASGGSAS